MFETIVVPTDGSESVRRAVHVALDLADRFDATVHAISIVDTDEVESSPERLQEDMETALKEQAQKALSEVEAVTERDIVTSVRIGRPATEIREYAEANDADLVAMGTRGRHGENRFLLGSVAERIVRTCPMPVLTVRQLAEEETPSSQPR